jgi:hypothetical protein
MSALSVTTVNGTDVPQTETDRVPEKPPPVTTQANMPWEERSCTDESVGRARWLTTSVVDWLVRKPVLPSEIAVRLCGSPYAGESADVHVAVPSGSAATVQSFVEPFQNEML